MAVAQHGIGNNSEAMAHLKMALESEQPFPEEEEARELLEKLVEKD
jgi:hypothetical protein